MPGSQQLSSRRRFISGMAGVLTLPYAGHIQALSSAVPLRQPRELEFYHTHTGKSLALVYHDGETHIASAMAQVNQFLGDFRTGEIHTIDPQLLDLLYVLQHKTGIENRYEIISAYRSPKTNALLRNNSKGVAKRSLHMQGKAVDVRLVGANTRQLRETAIALKLGGVGYYRRSDFVHLDTGRVRYW